MAKRKEPRPMENKNEHLSSPKGQEEKESFFLRKVWLSPVFYVYFISVLTALGILYVNRENMVNRNSIFPDLAIDSVYDEPINDVSLSTANTGTKIDISTLLQPTKTQMEKGEQLFKVDCSSCHGLDGEGDGQASASLNPKPRDFHATTGWKNGRLLSQMFKTVAEGISGSAMVSFSAAFPVSDRVAIIDYIRATFGDFPKDTPEQLEAMVATYQIGKVEAPRTRIPVSEAVSQIEEGAIPLVRTVAAISSYISQHPEDEGSRILSSVVIDRQLALSMLANSNFWSKNQSDFVMIITANSVQNGFDPKVSQLSAQEWETLYNYLKGLFSSKNLASNNG